MACRAQHPHGNHRPSAIRKVDVRLPGKESSNFHGARPVLLIITMIEWIRTRRLSIKKSLSLGWGVGCEAEGLGVCFLGFVRRVACFGFQVPGFIVLWILVRVSRSLRAPGFGFRGSGP